MRHGGFLVVLVGALALNGCAVAPWNQLSDDDVVALRESASDYQQGVLDDGYVSEAEYRQAVQSMWDCVADAGAVPDPIERSGDSELTFSYSVEKPTEAAVDAVNEKTDACLPEHLDAVGRVWVSQGAALTP